MMRVAFYGTGGYARAHAESLRRLGVSIAACWGTNAEKTTAFARDYGATVFADWREMVSKKKCDALYIVIPPFAHDGAVEQLAVRKGLPFLCEKPVGLELKLSQKIARKIEKKKLVTSTGYQLRYWAELDEVKSVLARNRLSLVRACRFASCPQKAWWLKMATSGGMVVEQTTHLVDLLRFLFGEVKSVSAFTASGISSGKYPDCDVFDSIEGVMRFENGVVGSLGATNLLNNKFSKVVPLEVCGEDFYLHFEGDKIGYKEKTNEWAEKTLSSANPQDAMNKAFITAIEKNDPSLVRSSYPDGVRTLALTLAFNKSAFTGKTVGM